MKDTGKTLAFQNRTASFGEGILSLCMGIKINIYNKSTITQLLRSSASIGANYCEAANASSKRDFRNKIFICKKEAQETKYWLRRLTKSNPGLKDKIIIFWRECHEFSLIFQATINTLDHKK